MQIKTRLAALLAAAVLLLSSCGGKAEKRREYDVRVILRETEGITVTGDNIIDTKSGRTVTFKVTVNPGYVYIGNTAGADFDEESGRLRLSGVFAPATVDMIVVPEDEVINVKIEKNDPDGILSLEEAKLAGPGDLTVSADTTAFLQFAGWSEGGYLEDGGRLLSTEPTHTFYIDGSKTLYANFSGFASYDIIYNLNGGHVADGVEETYTRKGKFNDLFAMQNTMESNGTFVRDGYAAVGYSTVPADYSDYYSANEIPGFSNMGGVCKVDGESLNLYVVWAKETQEADFIYRDVDISDVSESGFRMGTLPESYGEMQGVEITAYIGSSKLAVIPEEIGGKPVVKVASGAFASDVERVVIPRTVKFIEKNAFSACDRLREVVFFDSVVLVYDESFPESVSTVVLNAQRLPVYSGQIEGSFNVKYDRLRTVEGKKIVVVSGSSSLNGINSELFEELMPGYSVVNYGTNAANSMLFFLDVISKYTGEGDIVVHAPEYGRGGPMGSNEFHTKMFRGNEQCYDIFRDVDLRDYSGFWSCWRKFQIGDSADNSIVPAVRQEGKEYQLTADINKYGDIATKRKSVRGSFGGANVNLSDAHLYSDYLNAVSEKVKANGGVMVMSFGPHDKSRIAQSSLTRSAFDRANEYCADELDYPVISDVGDYIMDHEKFYDSEWHLNEDGAKERTQNLAEDIQKYLADPSAY